MSLIEKVSAHADEFISWRRQIHAHPELGFKEFETTRFIMEKLKSWGIDVRPNGDKTGVIGTLKGGKPGTKTVALRCDIDALPMQEKTGLEFASQTDGVCHACGHDLHTATLLGTAYMLSQHYRDQLAGTVRFIFQPAEETLGGSISMIENGALDGVDCILGAHTWPDVEGGCIGIRKGPAMGSNDSFHITVHGKGGHGASPHETHDPVVAAGQIICALQTFVSRELNPLKNAVISVGIMKAGGAFNVIPGEVELTGTARSFEPQISQDCETFIKRMGDNIGAAFRCTADLDYARNLPPTVNTPEMALMGAEIGKKVFGESCVRKIEPTMGGEDFSFYLEKVPGAFFFIGVGDESKGTKWPHHHCRFTIDEAQLCKGSAFEALCAWEFLNK